MGSRKTDIRRQKIARSGRHERDRTNPVIRDIAEKIAREYQPEKIILFGSHAWGTPGPDSDVDLFIVKESTKRRIEREADLRMLLFGNRFPAMDILVYTPDELRHRMSLGDFFVREILDRGRVLYGRR
jgi:predicted nucleotidyltransferase